MTPVSFCSPWPQSPLNSLELLFELQQHGMARSISSQSGICCTYELRQFFQAALRVSPSLLCSITDTHCSISS